MEHLSPLIIDLAFILILAATTTVIFKLLKQPVVLGYLVAGFLAGSHVDWFPGVHQSVDIENWAEIGIVFLLFGLGLEFSFKKLMNVGKTALTSALIILGGMMLCGFLTGKAMDWGNTDSLFLGVMLSMSSTTIIIKAFSDLGLRNKQFTGVVFGILIVEDLFAVIMMVILSTLFVGMGDNINSIGASGSSGIDIAWSILKLVFFLVVWFGLGISIIPSLLRKAKKILNEETLLILAVGLCLGMVVLANLVGLSSALGAFIIGSILAETIQSKEIIKLTTPLRDLFGAVFFISVGMLVDPSIVVTYWYEIMVITIVVIIGQILFTSIGVITSGRGLKIAIESGFSLTQIGEFAFIIASLGISLGVTSSFLYPVAVTVSVITTFTTPFIIKLAPRVYNLLEKKLPTSIKTILADRESLENRIDTKSNKNSDWKLLLKSYIPTILVFSILLMGLEWLLISYIFPMVENYEQSEFITHIIKTSIALIVMAPFIWGLAIKKIESQILIRLWSNSNFNRGFIVSLALLRGALAIGFIMFMMIYIYSYKVGILFGLLLMGCILLIFSKRLQRWWVKFEYRFKRNIDSNKTIRKISKTASDLNIAKTRISPDCRLCGRTLSDITIRQLYGIGIINIRRGNRIISVPESHEMLMPYDELTIVGNDAAVRSFTKLVETSDSDIIVESEDSDCTNINSANSNREIISHVWLRKGTRYIDTSLKDSMIRESFKCIVVWIDRHDGTSIMPDGRTIFRLGDVVWIAGSTKNINTLKDHIHNSTK